MTTKQTNMNIFTIISKSALILVGNALYLYCKLINNIIGNPMKNNLKIILFALFLCVNILPVKSQTAEHDPRYNPVSPWDELLNEKVGVKYIRVKLPKYVTTRWISKENNSYRELCEESLGLSATFIDSKTGKRIKFYEGNDYYLKQFPDKKSLESDIFRTDGHGQFYDVLRLKSTKTYKQDSLGNYDILTEDRIENRYRLQPHARRYDNEMQIYYVDEVCNGEIYHIFLGCTSPIYEYWYIHAK